MLIVSNFLVRTTTMSKQTCWRCFCRVSVGSDLSPSISHHSRRLPITLQQCTAFSTTARSMVAPRTKVAPPKRGVKTTFTVRKKKRSIESKGRPPAPGERKALRKRIVLSNTNALEVAGMVNLTAESLVKEGLQGEVLGIPGAVVDQLRAVEAFKVSQGWGLFRRPGMLFRRETLEYGKLFNELTEKQNKTVRRIIVGERGSGKSMMLLQAMTMAFLKNWVVISLPEGTLFAAKVQYTQSDPTSHGSCHRPYRLRSPSRLFASTVHSEILHSKAPRCHSQSESDPLHPPTFRCTSTQPPGSAPRKRLARPSRSTGCGRPGNRMANLHGSLD